MAIIAPFRGVRFNPAKVEDFEDVVTPPYDVISEKAGEAFLKKNKYNMIQLDLRNNSQSKDAGNERYAEAAARFESWQHENILIREDKESIYLYYIDYKHPSGRRMTRKGLVSLVGLADFSEGIVKPHEKTFDAVVADRLELMDTCRAQFSKVFSLFSDEENQVISALESAREPEPLASVKDHLGNTHTIWRVSDPDTLARVATMFNDKPVYIADGHHRYTTALQCRKRAMERNPDLAATSPYNFIMMYLCSMQDEGLSILPTHRLVSKPGALSAEELVNTMKSGFEVEEIVGGTREILLGEVMARMNESASSNPDQVVLGAYHPGEDRCFFLRLREGALDNPRLSAKAEVLRKLDVVVLSDLIINEYLHLDHKLCVAEKLVEYFSDPDNALDRAVKLSVTDDGNTPILLLLNPTRVEQVRDVADNAEIMPHKSTYFYPKIITGLVINKLVENEKIHIVSR